MRLTLKALRAQRNLTQTEAGKLIGVNTDTWARYENHKTYPDVPTIKRIEKAFDVSYDDIIFLPNNTIKS